jgi:Xaa-Pro aminopeptidase
MKNNIEGRCKTAEAVNSIQATQEAVEAAMTTLIEYLQSSTQPSAEVAHAVIDDVLAQYDCESPDGHIVASGTMSAEPHEHGFGLIKSGVPIVIDIYPRSKRTGYFADMSRTICLGTPSQELQKMYDTVLEAQTLAISLLAPGVSAATIQSAVEDFFSDAGYETSGKGTEFAYSEGFVHGIGHGVGKQIHEAPSLGRRSEAVLMIGDVVTIEPGLYYKHIGGVRIEDMLYIAPEGVVNLTKFSKTLTV